VEIVSYKKGANYPVRKPLDKARLLFI